MPKPIKWPMFHFALLGLVLFAGAKGFSANQEPARVPDTRIVVSRSQVAVLVDRYEATSGIAATDDIRAQLIADFAEEEMLYREALRWELSSKNQAVDLRLRQKMAFVSEGDLSDEELERQAKALGLGADDAVIRSMLTHNMRLLLARNGEREPTVEELEAFYTAESERFASPLRFTGWQVFFAWETRQTTAYAAADALKIEMNAEMLKPADAVARGDLFPAGSQFTGQLQRQLAARFGEQFAAVAAGLPEGEWSPPVESPFGVHLVFIEERTQAQRPPLEDIRSRVAAMYRSSEREKRLAVAMNELRARYRVVVE